MSMTCRIPVQYDSRTDATRFKVFFFYSSLYCLISQKLSGFSIVAKKNHFSLNLEGISKSFNKTHSKINNEKENATIGESSCYHRLPSHVGFTDPNTFDIFMVYLYTWK